MVSCGNWNLQFRGSRQVAHEWWPWHIWAGRALGGHSPPHASCENGERCSRVTRSSVCIMETGGAKLSSAAFR